MIDILLFGFVNVMLLTFLGLTFKKYYFGFLGGTLGMVLSAWIFADPDTLFLMDTQIFPNGTTLEVTQPIGLLILIPVFLSLGCLLAMIEVKWG